MRFLGQSMPLQWMPRTFFEIEIPAIQEFWSSFSPQQAMRIQQPTLAVVGTASEPPLREGHQMIQSWLNVEPREIVGGNHLFPVTKPTQVAEILSDFLAHHTVA